MTTEQVSLTYTKFYPSKADITRKDKMRRLIIAAARAKDMTAYEFVMSVLEDDPTVRAVRKLANTAK